MLFSSHLLSWLPGIDDIFSSRNVVQLLSSDTPNRPAEAAKSLCEAPSQTKRRGDRRRPVSLEEQAALQPQPAAGRHPDLTWSGYLPEAAADGRPARILNADGGEPVIDGRPSALNWRYILKVSARCRAAASEARAKVLQRGWRSTGWKGFAGSFLCRSQSGERDCWCNGVDTMRPVSGENGSCALSPG